MMKICLILPNLAGGGAEKVVIALSNELVKKHSVTIIVGDKINDYQKLISNRIKILNIDNSFKPGLINAFKFYFSVRKVFDNYDIVHSNLTTPNLLACFCKLLLHNSKFKLVITEHNNFKIRFKGFKGFLYRKIISYLYFFADLITSVSQDLSFEIESSIKREVITVYNPVDIVKIKDLINSNTVLPRRNGVKRIINIGRLVKQKNQILLIKAFKLFNSVNPNSELLIFGKGDLFHELRDKISDLGLDKSVFLMGFTENIYVELFNSDLFVLTSSWEGFGNVIIESMASKCKVLSLDCNFGPREIINNNKNGFIIPKTNSPTVIAKKIESCLNNNLNVIDNAVKFVEKFDIKNITKKYLSLYKKF